jgi:PAS domain S-box-containing protein
MLTSAVLTAETLAGIFEQSVDCVKLVGLDGSIQWMNANGLCAMEIDDFEAVRGQQWAALWPEAARAEVAASMPIAQLGETVRFDAFCPTAKGSARWWNVTVSKVSSATGEVGFLAVSRDITEAEVGRQALVIAAAELRHRLKNTYAMISSLLYGFARGVPEREAFARDMQSRLVSLSAAQALFSTDDAPCDLSTLIPALVLPFESPSCPIAIEALPGLSVEQGQADAIALVLGELAVNSAKHGALANGGAIRITAEAGDESFAIIWEETLLGEVRAHGRSGGQGLNLIQRIVSARSGALEIDWRERGLAVTLRFARAA